MTKRFTLHIPEQYNDGSPVGPIVFGPLEDRLLSVAGGFTVTAARGAWKGDDGRVYREPVRLYMVDADASAELRLRELADLFGHALGQEAVYLTVADLDTSLIYPTAPTVEKVRQP